MDPPIGAAGSALRNMEKYWVGQVELYDGTNWRLLAAATLPFFGLSLVGDDEVVRLTESADGLLVLEVYRLSLEGRPPD